tara:strand:+ start:731 stop:1042 length:312 start_codon:yes stop_codon:yes gene_type:complete
MIFEPVNRFISIEEVEFEEDEIEDNASSNILLPEEYQEEVRELYGLYYFLCSAKDCSLDVREGDMLIVDNSMVQRVKVGEVEHLIVLENYVVGVIYNDEKEKE